MNEEQRAVQTAVEKMIALGLLPKTVTFDQGAENYSKVRELLRHIQRDMAEWTRAEEYQQVGRLILKKTEFWLYDGTLVRMEVTAQGTLKVDVLNDEGVWEPDMSMRTEIMYDRNNLARKLTKEEAEAEIRQRGVQ